MNDAALAVVLWGLTVLLLGWTWVPALLSGLGATRYADGGSEDPTVIQMAAEPDYLFWHGQLTALGYEPVGVAWMRLAFYGAEWRYEVHVRAYRSADREVFAFVQKQPRPLDVWWLVIFATTWHDGGLLLTNNGSDQPPDAGDYVTQGMESTDLAGRGIALGEVVRLRTGGRRAAADGRLDTLLQATTRHAGPQVALHGVKLGQSYLLANGAIHVLLSLPRGADDGLRPLVGTDGESGPGVRARRQQLRGEAGAGRRMRGTARAGVSVPRPGKPSVARAWPAIPGRRPGKTGETATRGTRGNVPGPPSPGVTFLTRTRTFGSPPPSAGRSGPGRASESCHLFRSYRDVSAR